ncbi:MAG TPA: isoprenylcysteine carboxylmethyltransferase family protein [Vicinamibacterales bacterium]|nr:isoprenylcysteine carboxylmethyltransferase family protein [Vicinamibacterales bacterium]
MISLALCALVFVPMIFEARLSARHDAVLRERGAVEPAGDVFRAMQLCYPGAFLAMMAEGFLRDQHPDQAGAVGLLVFASAKALKYWAMATLRERWTFRVLVPPGSARVVGGPYRVIRHPNYVAVLGELAGVALMAHAWIAGPAGTALFAALLWLRIRVEERALGIESRR